MKLVLLSHLGTIYLIQWLPNFFMHDPNLSLINISRPTPKTSKKCIYVLRKRKWVKLLYYYIDELSYDQLCYQP